MAIVSSCLRLLHPKAMEGIRPRFVPDFCTENPQRPQRRNFGAPLLTSAPFGFRSGEPTFAGGRILPLSFPTLLVEYHQEIAELAVGPHNSRRGERT
jgi:hypothetical protein